MNFDLAPWCVFQLKRFLLEVPLPGGVCRVSRLTVLWVGSVGGGGGGGGVGSVGGSGGGSGGGGAILLNKFSGGVVAAGGAAAAALGVGRHDRPRQTGPTSLIQNRPPPPRTTT